jgi:hypothetical protein
MTKESAATIAPALRGKTVHPGVTRRVRPGAVDTACARFRMMMTTRRKKSDGGGGDDTLRDRGAEVPMELRSRVLVAKATFRPSDIAYVPLMTRSIPLDVIVDGGVGPGVGVLARTVLMMLMPARGRKDAHIAAITRTDADIDHPHILPAPTKCLAPKRCQTG